MASKFGLRRFDTGHKLYTRDLWRGMTCVRTVLMHCSITNVFTNVTVLFGVELKDGYNSKDQSTGNIGNHNTTLC